MCVKIKKVPKKDQIKMTPNKKGMEKCNHIISSSESTLILTTLSEYSINLISLILKVEVLIYSKKKKKKKAEVFTFNLA